MVLPSNDENHCNSLPVFFRWIKAVAALKSLIILDKIILDILPTSVLLVLTNLHFIVARKLPLWSFIVLYDLELANLRIRLPDISFLINLFWAQEFIRSTEFLSHLL